MFVATTLWTTFGRLQAVLRMRPDYPGVVWSHYSRDEREYPRELCHANTPSFNTLSFILTVRVGSPCRPGIKESMPKVTFPRHKP